MHILLMLFLILVGCALGENVSYILGLPIIALGLYVGFVDWGGKQGKRLREQAEGLFVVLDRTGNRSGSAENAWH